MRSAVPGETYRRILEVAETVLGEHGYHGTRLDEIARHVGVRKASLFHHFASKEHLYRAVVAHGLGEATAVVDAVLGEARTPTVEVVVALAEAWIDLVARHPARTKTLLRESLGDAPAGLERSDLERLLDRVAAFVMAGQQRGTFADSVDPAAFVLGLVGMIAFLEACGPAIAPAGFGPGAGDAGRARLKRHVARLVRRCLDPHDASGLAAEPARTAAAERA